MQNTLFQVIGVMSGTSLDGIDLVQLKLWKNKNTWDYHIAVAETIAYPKKWKIILAEANQYTPEKLLALDEKYTEYLASVIRNFIGKNQFSAIDAICTHGHTILHQPENGITLQIGNLPKLAKLLTKKVVCNFRTQDVNLGGQGAPLVPIGDWLLFSQYDYCLNLGGFANISSEIETTRIAYDICAVNTVLNRYAEKLGAPFDEDGKLAASGTVNSSLLKTLNNLNFYQKEAPKSLGIEWVNAEIFPLLEKSRLSAQDILTTYTQHIAFQISQAFKNKGNKSILITGGGAHNKQLISLIKKNSHAKLIIPEKKLIDYKEAVIFGLLGVLKLREEVNVLKSVTGASKNHSAGEVFYP